MVTGIVTRGQGISRIVPAEELRSRRGASGCSVVGALKSSRKQRNTTTHDKWAEPLNDGG
ncbi:hypothetical protein [Mycobacterium camsae]|uniref:hypothetical protein n=1 Tax=Mycobacterium gordonae TaxID=1778 RepID=UPI00197D69B1|nr:hypothetical protein [Mycobacterium gordonae]